ncbi:MAG: hypothetical protein ACLSE6_03565 [Alphaproteobacteria bacterium]
MLLLLSVGMIGFIYVAEVDYTPVVIWKIFYMDTILFSSLLGMLIYIGSQKLYQRMKAGNGGHAISLARWFCRLFFAEGVCI